MRVASTQIFRSSPTSPDAVEYCRQARRVRCRFAGQPERMHYELTSLSRRQDRLSGKAKWDPDRMRIATVVQPKQVSGATIFAEQVEGAMDGSVLRYSMRLQLLKAADRAGIGRFEANLIIAAVQHRRSEQKSDPVTEYELPAKRSGFRLTLLAVAAVQGMILAAAAWAIHA